MCWVASGHSYEHDWGCSWLGGKCSCWRVLTAAIFSPGWTTQSTSRENASAQALLTDTFWAPPSNTLPVPVPVRGREHEVWAVHNNYRLGPKINCCYIPVQLQFTIHVKRMYHLYFPWRWFLCLYSLHPMSSHVQKPGTSTPHQSWWVKWC